MGDKTFITSYDKKECIKTTDKRLFQSYGLETFSGVITNTCAWVYTYLNICYNIPFNLTSYIYGVLLKKVVVQNMCVVSSLWIKKYLKDDNIEICNKEEMRGWKSCPEFDRVANFFLFVYIKTFKIFLYRRFAYRYIKWC